MTTKTITLFVRRLVVLATAAPLLCGCLNDKDPGPCPPDTFMFNVRAYDNSGAELGQADVSSVVLYLFDGSLRFAGSMGAHIGQQIELESTPGQDMHIVAWGNLKRDPQLSGENVGDFGVGLQPDTRAVNYVAPPDDIFWGRTTIAPQQQKGNAEMPVTRKVGSLAVTVKGLRQFAGFADDDYSIVVGETYSVIGFDGSLSGERVSYRPAGVFTGRGDFYVAPLNILPEEGIALDIYHGQTHIINIWRSGSGESIDIREGELTNVLIDMKTSVEVSVSLTPWGSEEVWKEF